MITTQNRAHRKTTKADPLVLGGRYIPTRLVTIRLIKIQIDYV